jgi:class 3 adenylate cyclase
MSDPPSVKTSYRTVMMADVVGSTALYEKIGNIAAKQQVGGCLDALSNAVESHTGRVVKSLGDGILSAFDSPEQAVMSAIAMCELTPRHDLEIRIGLHSGEVVEDAGDIFGDAVNTVSRIADLAKPSEILITKSLVEGLPPFVKSLVRRVQPVFVKGKKEPIELFTILTGDLSQTLAPVTIMDVPRPQTIARLQLSYREQSFTLRPGSDLTMGRDPENQIVIASQHVSRLHARIFHRQGKFVLVDHSANGTYLIPEDQPKLHLLREEALLHGYGHIYLGADPDTSESEPTLFQTFY